MHDEDASQLLVYVRRQPYAAHNDVSSLQPLSFKLPLFDGVSIAASSKHALSMMHEDSAYAHGDEIAHTPYEIECYLVTPSLRAGSSAAAALAASSSSGSGDAKSADAGGDSDAEVERIAQLRDKLLKERRLRHHRQQGDHHRKLPHARRHGQAERGESAPPLSDREALRLIEQGRELERQARKGRVDCGQGLFGNDTFIELYVASAMLVMQALVACSAPKQSRARSLLMGAIFFMTCVWLQILILQTINRSRAQ